MTKNEIVGMKEIIPRISRDWVDQIIVVDGGSTDGTVEWARSQGLRVYIQKQSGFRQAYKEVLPFCIGDTLITFSPDGNSIPEIIPELAEKISEGYDMVIASRYLDGAKSFDDTLLSGLGNKFFTWSINFFHGGKYSDAMVIFRAYRISLIEELDIGNEKRYRVAEAIFRCRGLSWEPLLSIRAAKKRIRITEIPGDEPKRLSGESRVMPNLLVRLQWAGVFYYQILSEFVKR